MTETLFGSALFNAIVFASGVASIISLLIGLQKYRRSVVVGHVVLVVALSVFASYSFFNYSELRDAERALANRKALARQDAAALLRGLPGNITYWEPGQGRGIALSGLAFLEQHRELYPATFELAQTVVRRDIEAAQQAAGTPEERQRMETAGVAMLQILRGIAGGQ